LLGGSEGGDMMSHAAPLFAQRGYVAASVAYFGAPGLPQTLENVPVETIGKAIADVAARPDVDANRIAVLGLSKGGELALLTASLYPQIHAVVAAVPSPFAWQGIGQGPGAPVSSWTFRGQPLPYVPYGTAMGAQFGAAMATHAPIDLRKGYDASYEEHRSDVPAAMFHLENINGPVLFVAAGDDGIWNSPLQSQIGMEYLREHHHPYADRYEQYPGAGHIFLFSAPDRPMTTAPMGPFTLLLGGTPQANAQAREEAWPKIFAFLNQALR
jgi:dienelactone hydrolase